MQARLLLCARLWTRTRADAEDVVQEAFVRFWRHQRQLGGDPFPLLLTSVRRAAIDLGRSQSRPAQYSVINRAFFDALGITDLNEVQSWAPGQTFTASGGGRGGVEASIVASGSNANGTSSIDFSDSTGRVEIRTDAGRRTVVVKNPDGTVIFTGPFGTDAERSAAPVAIRARVDEVEKRIRATTSLKVP